MEKKTPEKQMTGKTLLISLGCTSVEGAIKEIKDAESTIIALGGSNISVDLTMESYYYESGEYPRIQFSYSILETDEELQKRIVWEDKQRIRKLEQFEKLKKELGK